METKASEREKSSKRKSSYYDIHHSQPFFFSPLPVSFSRPPFGTMLRTFVSEVASRGLRVQAVPAMSRGFAKSTFLFFSSAVVAERRFFDFAFDDASPFFIYG